MIHVAVLLPAYLDLILNGEKTVECRLTRQAFAPFNAIEPGERIYFKQSAGPYRATAIAEHVLSEGNLTPKRIRQMERDYNALIRGEQMFWKQRADCRYITLIWLTDVQPIDTGPAIRNLQGRAWEVLEEEPAWRKPQPLTESFAVEITPGNLKNNTMYATKVIDRFPKWTIGGSNGQSKAKPITLMLHNGPTIETDIVGQRKLFRWRGWGKWFQQHKAMAHDRVVFTPVDEATYFVGLTRSTRE